MRISDWSSDVCSSDLPGDREAGEAKPTEQEHERRIAGYDSKIGAERPRFAARMPGLARAERFAHRQEEKQGDEKPRRAEDIKGAAPSQQLRPPPPQRKAEQGTERHASGLERQGPDACGRWNGVGDHRMGRRDTDGLSTPHKARNR